MPVAEDYLASSNRFVTRADLSAMRQARLVVRRMATASAAAARVRVKFSTVNPTGTAYVPGDWLDLCTAELGVSINVTNTTIVTAWLDLVAGARGDVYLSPLSVGGDGTLAPVLGSVSLQLRP